jgi:hypothetical protein
MRSAIVSENSVLCSLAAALAAVLLGACGSDQDDVPREGLEFDFRAGVQGWQAGFADYPVGREADVQFVADHRALPQPLGPERALYVSAFNLSDDLFVYFKRRIEGLEPNRTYRAYFQIGLASNVARGCDFGTGEATWIKTGASGHEPVTTVQGQDVRLNIDIGGQLNDGRNALLLGDMRNEHPDCSDHSYGGKTLDSGERFLEATSAADGTLWLIFGADSGFETPFHLYFTSFRVRLEP